MARRKKTIVKVIAIVLAVLMPVLTGIVAFAEDSGTVGSVVLGISKYAKPDINALTGHGEEPEELSVSAGATYQEKAWYEYVAYSDHAVASYRLNDDSRLLFYDPYTYVNSMVMDVQFDAKTTEFDTMSSYTVSHTNSKSIDSAVHSTYTDTSAVQTSGRDISGSNVSNTGDTKTVYGHEIVNKTTGKAENKTQYYYKEKDYETSSHTTGWSQASATEIGTKSGGSIPLLGLEFEASETITIGHNSSDVTNKNTAILQDYTTNTTTYSPDYSTSTKYTGSDTVEYNTTSSTEGWTELSARVTKTIGSSSSTSNSWSETEGVTVTKTYEATHFAADGVTPLPWAIVHYAVQMPMKCCLQYMHSGEWVTVSTVYCLMTTVKGTCRAWMQNGQVYYEDWGSGEPVVATDFWSQFMTIDGLVNAYKNKLYPTGGED